MADQLNIILVPHTHWDREWYQTFQQFRIRLVHTIDKLLDILDRDDKFSHFMLDGQTIVLDDYLEVQPEQEERLRGYVRAGRIEVGPWYLQPDEFLVSGESLIRNLQIGLRRAAEFGGGMRVGYVPDCFGHIAQLPQILRGFGIDNAIFWRGVGEEAHKSEFYWAAPDGTQILVAHLADPLGYSNARLMPLQAEEFATRVKLLASQILPKATTNTLLFMNGSDHLEPQDGLPGIIEAANGLLAHISADQGKILTHVELDGANSDDRHFDAIHVRIGTLPQYVVALRQQMNGRAQGTQKTQKTQETQGTEGTGKREEGEDGPREAMQVLQGEMRSSQFSHLLPSVLSTRMWIKQQNTATEHLLERWVEPLAAWAWKLGAAYPGGLVKLAWKYLLQNHPHDSICGCSIDQVHRENAIRFTESQQVAEGALAQVMHSLIAAMDTRAPVAVTHTSHKPLPIVVFNPAPGPRTEAVQAVVQFPGSLQNAVIIDERGEQMPYGVVKRWRQEIGSMPVSRETVAAAVALAGEQAPGEFIRMAEGMVTMFLGQPQQAYEITQVRIDTQRQPGVAYIELMLAPQERVTDYNQELLAVEQQMFAVLQREDINMLEVSVIDQAHETIDFVAADLPAYGMKTFWMYSRGLTEEAHIPPASALAGDQRSIENEWYRVEASAEDGTLTVSDKQTGAVFTGLNRFVDGGDVGDLYTYCPPAQDTLISNPEEPPKIELVSAGPVRATLRVTGNWSLPGTCLDDRSGRDSQAVICQISSEITLIPGVRRVDIHTSVENKVKDHRLRVIFPVSYTVDSASAEGTFEVRRRPATALRPEDVTDWLEEPVNTFPQKRFVDISDGTTGLGILNRGLPEYEVLREGPGIAPGQTAVAVTLLRCVEWLSRADLSTRRGHAGPMEFTPDAQCLGRQEFDYALVPHSGDWEAGEALVLREAQAFNTPVRAVVLSPAEARAEEQKEKQTAEASPAEALPLTSRAMLIEVEPRELVVSAIKRANSGDGLVVRVYNPLAHAVEAAFRPGFAATRVFVANLEEEPQEQLLWSGEGDGPLHVGIRAGGIMTLLFL